MIFFGLLIIAVGAGLYFTNQEPTSAGTMTTVKKLFNLPDVNPDVQGGSFKRDYDLEFQSVSDETGVPFALLKAHAIRESSLNEKAFRDENPSKRTDRIGWASRGLMQILWWPNSNRWGKYGFPDATLGPMGENMFNPYINIKIAAHLIRDNLNACGGNVRDAINMYNTGKKEAQYQAPHDYVNKVLSSYETLIKRKVT